MPAQFSCPLIVVVPGQLITASLWNGEFNNLFVNLIPAGIDTYSSTDVQMQTATDPFPSSITSRPTSLAGEIERIRFTTKGIKGTTYWYEPPAIDLATADTDITALQAKFPVAPADLADNSVTTSKIANGAVTEAKIAASVAGTGLTGGAGTSLSVADGGITSAKLASALTISTLNVSTALQFAGLNTLKIMQVVVGTTATTALTTSTSFVDTTLSVTITPKISTSYILVLVSATARQNAGDQGYFTIARGAVNVAGNVNGFFGTTAVNNYCLSMVAYDPPGTGAATVYKVQFRTQGGAGSIELCPSIGGQTSLASIIAIEIAQ